MMTERKKTALAIAVACTMIAGGSAIIAASIDMMATEAKAETKHSLVLRANEGESIKMVYYHKNGGEWDGDIPSTEVKTGEAWTVTTVVPHKEGCDLLGWAWDSGATEALYQPGEVVESYDKDTTSTLYAVWKTKTIKVSYDLNGGTGEIEPTIATYGEKFTTIATAKPAKAGYAFAGWFTDKDGGTQVTSDTVFNLTINETYTLYAHWNTASDIADQAKSGIEELLGNWFTADKVAMIMSWVTYACTLIVLAVKLKGAIKDKTLTISDVKDAVLEAVDGKVDSAIKDKMGEYLDKAEASQEATKKVLDAFAKILALSQDGSAESRVAILDVLTQLGSVDQKTIAEAKQSVEDGKASEEATKEALERIASSADEDDGTSI